MERRRRGNWPVLVKQREGRTVKREIAGIIEEGAERGKYIAVLGVEGEAPRSVFSEQQRKMMKVRRGKRKSDRKG